MRAGKEGVEPGCDLPNLNAPGRLTPELQAPLYLGCAREYYREGSDRRRRVRGLAENTTCSKVARTALRTSLDHARVDCDVENRSDMVPKAAKVPHE